MNIYSNPSNGYLEIQIENELDQDFTILINNNLGQIFYNSNLIQNEESWNKSVYIPTSGVYYVTTLIGKKRISKRIIVNNQK